MRGDWDRGNIPAEFIDRKFPSTLSTLVGRKWVVHNLGDTVFRLKEDTVPAHPFSYSAGTLVRLINDVGVARYSHSPGFSYSAEMVTVCRIDATQAETLEARKESLEFVSPVPRRPLRQHIDEAWSVLREIAEDPWAASSTLIEAVITRLPKLRSTNTNR